MGGGEKDGAHYDELLKDESELYGFPGRSEILWEYICDKLLRFADDDTTIYQLADKYISEITEFLEDETKPVSQRRYSDDQKWQIILRWRYKLDYADDEVLSCYRNTVNYFCELDDTEAMEIKAASCAGGDKAFECDWDYARSVYENSFNADGVKFAFEIGKIYYYGYCNNGVPEYEKALNYFSHDVLSDSITESKLYIAEMYYNGYGVATNKPYAYYILDQMSDDIENLIYSRIKKKPFGLMPCDWVYYAKANMLLGDYLLS